MLLALGEPRASVKGPFQWSSLGCLTPRGRSKSDVLLRSQWAPSHPGERGEDLGEQVRNWVVHGEDCGRVVLKLCFCKIYTEAYFSNADRPVSTLTFRSTSEAKTNDSICI